MIINKQLSLHYKLNLIFDYNVKYKIQNNYV